MAKIKVETLENVVNETNALGTDTPRTTQVEKKSEFIDPDNFILNILKKFSSYKELYVDRGGGTYTTDTPAHLRPHAQLFKNPFFKK